MKWIKKRVTDLACRLSKIKEIWETLDRILDWINNLDQSESESDPDLDLDLDLESDSDDSKSGAAASV